MFYHQMFSNLKVAGFIHTIIAVCELDALYLVRMRVENLFDMEHPAFINFMNTTQKAYSGIGCEVLCGVLQIVGEGVAWECRAWSTLTGCHKVFRLDGMAQHQECDHASYYLWSLHCCHCRCLR